MHKIVNVTVGRPKNNASNGVLIAVLSLHNLFLKNNSKSDCYYFSDKESSETRDNFKKYSYSFLSMLAITKKLAKIDADIIYFHGGCQIIFAPMILLLGLIYKKKNIVVVPHGAYSKGSFEKRSFLKKMYSYFIEKIIYYYVNKFQCLNNNEAIDLIYIMNIDKKKIVEIPLHIDTLASKNNIHYENEEIVLFLGRIDWKMKGLDLLVDAFNDLNKKNYKLYLVGPINDEHSKKNLEIALSMNSNIIYKTPVYGIEKDKLLKKSKIFALLSKSEGLPTGLLEALMYGKQCITTKESNLDQKLLDDYIYECNFDPVSVKSQLNIAMSDYRNKELVDKQIRSVLNIYNPELIYQNHQKFIREL